jgi:hypothetical protein
VSDQKAIKKCKNIYSGELVDNQQYYSTMLTTLLGVVNDGDQP